MGTQWTSSPSWRAQRRRSQKRLSSLLQVSQRGISSHSFRLTIGPNCYSCSEPRSRSKVADASQQLQRAALVASSAVQVPWSTASDVWQPSFRHGVNAAPIPSPHTPIPPRERPSVSGAWAHIRQVQQPPSCKSFWEALQISERGPAIRTPCRPRLGAFLAGNGSPTASLRGRV